MRKYWILVVIVALVIMFITPVGWYAWAYPCLGAFVFAALALLGWPRHVWDWALVATAAVFLAAIPFVSQMLVFYGVCWALFLVFFVLKKAREMRAAAAGRPGKKPVRPARHD